MQETKSSSDTMFLINKVSRRTNSETCSSAEESEKQEDQRNPNNEISAKSNVSIATDETTLLKRGRWTEEEDEMLLKLFKKYGKRWIKIFREMKTRSWKQIRDRYVNILDPNMSKEPFSVDEDIKIYDLHFKLGNEWRDYCEHLPGRSADRIKNRYHSSIKGKELLIRLYKCL